MRIVLLQNPAAAWPTTNLAQRLEDCRLLLSVHGFLRPLESDRIQAAIQKRWKEQLNNAG